jgi:branched-chain amino acid transport system ATP-binding protein
MAEPLLRVRDLCKKFGGVLALNYVNLDFKDKVLKSIIGPNGAGKTTLVNVITGRLEPSSGTVNFEGRDVTGLPSHRLTQLGICRTFQITEIFPGLSVFENVRIARQLKLGGSMRMFSSKDSLKEVTRDTWEVLKRVKLADKAHVIARQLAHGDQRLLEVGMALASSPKILFLDEPTAGMSPLETEHIAHLIKDLSKEIAIVLIEHDMDVVMSISDEIAVLHQGTLIAEGPPGVIRQERRVKEAYLGE